MATAKYYSLGFSATNVARVREDIHEYAYLNQATGKWVPDPSVVDAVTGYYGDASTKELTLKQAQKLAKSIAPNVEPEWIDG